MTDAKPLIAKLERVKKGSRELNGHVALAVGWTVKAERGEKDATGQEWTRWLWKAPGKFGLWISLPNHGQIFEVANHVPHYTTSFDAALTLVPEGKDVDLYIAGLGGRYQSCAVDILHPETDEKLGTGNRTTPALALCIAALKARE
ncbi:hypothetical protein LCGC14_1894910 [marine sediment metagenome]|uniref:Uncharacterized protein n=1 Tax=marine sediment metagenome TaxID=412755 RepID=A0A0F9IWG1_9ZZZZ